MIQFYFEKKVEDNLEFKFKTDLHKKIYHQRMKKMMWDKINSRTITNQSKGNLHNESICKDKNAHLSSQVSVYTESLPIQNRKIFSKN